mmetsp:Transcript_73910/g.175914  ORF Transcript_73910/g.175914 Transcript_73910/m.175914 type:complete len:430 (+) Transcript_73910:101-1390(+)
MFAPPPQLAEAQRTLDKLLLTLSSEDPVPSECDPLEVTQPPYLTSPVAPTRAAVAVAAPLSSSNTVLESEEPHTAMPPPRNEYPVASDSTLKEPSIGAAYDQTSQAAYTYSEPTRESFEMAPSDDMHWAASLGDAAKTLQSLLHVLQDDRTDFDALPVPEQATSAAASRSQLDPQVQRELRDGRSAQHDLGGVAVDEPRAVRQQQRELTPEPAPSRTIPAAEAPPPPRAALPPGEAKQLPPPQQAAASEALQIPGKDQTDHQGATTKGGSRLEVGHRQQPQARPGSSGFGQHSSPLPKLSGREKPIEHSSIKGSFDLFDRNGDGVIACGELYEVLPILDPASWTEDKVTQFLKGADKNRDGSLQYEEFEACVLNFNDERFRRCLYELVSPSTAWAYAFRDSLAKTKKKKHAKKELGQEGGMGPQAVEAS